MWFTETPWPPIIALAMGAAACGGAFFSTRRAAWLCAIVPLVVAAAIIWYVERRIVTERENVESAIFEAADTFRSGDADRFANYFSAQSSYLQSVARSEAHRITVDDDLRITDVSIVMKNGDTRAMSHFRANGTFHVAEYAAGFRQPTRWEVGWQKEGGQWRIISVERLDPVDGQPMNPFGNPQDSD